MSGLPDDLRAIRSRATVPFNPDNYATENDPYGERVEARLNDRNTSLSQSCDKFLRYLGRAGSLRKRVDECPRPGISKFAIIAYVREIYGDPEAGLFHKGIMDVEAIEIACQVLGCDDLDEYCKAP